MLNFVECIKRGIEKEENIIDYHQWCIKNIPSIQRKFDESVVHVSDYSVFLEGNDKKCHRQLWYRLNGYDRKSPTLGEKIMYDHGLRIQTRYSYLIHLGLPNKYSIKGISVVLSENSESDLIVTGPMGDIIIEIKTMRGRAFDYLIEPRQSHALQCRGYQHEVGTDSGCVLCIDREGQNAPVQFNIEPDPILITKARLTANSIKKKDKESEVPKIGFAKVKVKENKTVDNSVYISMPWQCEYCKYLGVVCDGVLHRDEDISGIVGRINDDGEFYSEEYPELVSRWEPLIYESEQYKNIYDEGGDDNDSRDTGVVEDGESSE